MNSKTGSKSVNSRLSKLIAEIKGSSTQRANGGVCDDCRYYCPEKQPTDPRIDLRDSTFSCTKYNLTFYRRQNYACESYEESLKSKVERLLK